MIFNMFFFFFTDNEKKAIDVNDKILDHLINKYKEEIPFVVRKTDMNLMLEKGFWFYGKNDIVAISFWRGMDWVRKIPNISFVIDLKTDKCELVISTTDDQEKTKKIGEYLVDELNLIKQDEYTYSCNLLESTDYIENLDYFINNYRSKIDKIITKYFTSRSIKIKNSIAKIKVNDFNKELNYIKNYKKRIYDGSLPVTLNNIDIVKLGVLENIYIDNLPSNKQWIFIVGENGTGKSTFLRALTYAICNGPNINTDNKRKKVDLNIAITIDKYGKKPRHRIKELGIRDSKINSLGFVAFGPTRLNVKKQTFSSNRNRGVKDTGKDRNKENDNLIQLSNPYRPLFNSITTLIDLGFLMRVKNNKNAERFLEIDTLPEFEIKLKNIIEALLNVCEDIVDIHVGTSTKYLEVVSGKESRVEERTFSDLSSGYKNLIAMVTHLMVQLYIQQPKVNDPAQLVGIVIIDEIELHAHPRMQIEIVDKLSQIFPRIQFVVSTHSPIPMLGAKDNAIVLRTFKNDEGFHAERLMKLEKELKYLTPNTIFTSDIFDFDFFELLDDDEFDKGFLEDNYNDIEENKKLDERLKNLDPNIFPDNLFAKEDK